MWVSQGSAVRAQEATAAQTAVPAERGPVLLLEPPGGQPQSGLLLALRIQLGDGVPVETRELDTRLVDRAARTQAAEAVLAAEPARAVVWTEAPTPYSGFTVCTLRPVPGGGPPRLDVREVSGLQGPDLDRTIALEVSEILDQTSTSSTPSPVPTAPAPPSARPPPASEPRAEGEIAGWRLGFVGQLGAAAAPLGGIGYASWGPALAAGVGFGHERVRYELLAEASWMLPAERTAGTAVVEVQEVMPGLRLSAAAPIGEVWLGAYTAFALSLVAAEARNERTSGAESELVPSWLIGVAGELPLTPWVGLTLDVGAQVRLRRQRFSVDDDEVADSGKVRPLARVAIVFRPGS